MTSELSKAMQKVRRLSSEERIQYYDEPLWFGRGSQNCLAIWPNVGGRNNHHEIFIGNGKSGEKGPSIIITNDELDVLIGFFQHIRDGKRLENL